MKMRTELQANDDFISHRGVDGVGENIEFSEYKSWANRLEEVVPVQIPVAFSADGTASAWLSKRLDDGENETIVIPTEISSIENGLPTSAFNIDGIAGEVLSDSDVHLYSGEVVFGEDDTTATSSTYNFSIDVNPVTPGISLMTDSLRNSLFGSIDVKGVTAQSGFTYGGPLAGTIITYCFNYSDPGLPPYPDFFDSEKISLANDSNDSNLCWAGTASNMLYWSGWGKVYNGFTPHNEDSVFDYFRDHFENNGGWIDRGISWFLNGKTDYISSDIKEDGGDFYRNFNVNDYMTTGRYDDNPYYMLTLKNELASGKVAGLSIYWAGGGGHAITCWGIEVDNSKSIYASDYITAVYVSDSDDDVDGDPYNSVNRIKRCALTYDDDEGYYNISVPYPGLGVANAALKYWTTLDKRPVGSTNHDIAATGISVVQTAYNQASDTSTLKVDFSIRNAASAKLSNFKVSILVDGTEEYSYMVAGLDGRKDKTCTAYLTGISQANHTFKILADSDYNYWESNELNNSYSEDFTLENPAAVTGLSGDGDEGVAILSWSALVNANGVAKYQYEISKNSSFSTLEFSNYVVGTKTTANAALSSGTYYWRVRAVDSLLQDGDWSATKSFTFINASTSSYRFERRISAATSAGDYFGGAVSASDRNVLTGASGKTSGKGAAYLNRWNGKSYTAYTLQASDGVRGDSFGSSLDLYGTTAVVGAANHDRGIVDAGAVYVFRWTGSSYAQTKLMASDRAARDYFGYSTAIYGNTVAVGAYGDDDKGTDSGSVYAFRWNGTRYIQYKLLASDGVAYDNFGRAVDAGDNRIVVGSAADDDQGSNSGSAYVYRWSGSSYVQYKVKGNDVDSNDYFGSAVAISGNRIVVAAPGKVNSNGCIGCAYVFTWNGSSYVQTAKLIASDGKSDDRFGSSVSISGDTIIVGAYRDKNNGASVGSAYTYKWDGTSFVESKVKAYNRTSENSFGVSVGISSDLAVIGSYSSISKSTDAGSTYIYKNSAQGASGLITPSIPDLFSNNVAAKRATLDWSDCYGSGAGRIRYEVQLSKNNNFNSLVANATVTESQYRTGLLSASSNYYWRVRSVDAAGHVSDWSRSTGFGVSRAGGLASIS